MSDFLKFCVSHFTLPARTTRDLRTEKWRARHRAHYRKLRERKKARRARRQAA